jgi:hypothetical protein
MMARMETREEVRLTREHIEAQFPKACTACGRRFETLADYLRATRHAGLPVSYDADVGEWTPAEPIGVFALANCPCGTTLAITSRGMSLFTMWRLMLWARAESHCRGIGIRQLLGEVRSEIDRQVLAEYAGEAQETLILRHTSLGSQN